MTALYMYSGPQSTTNHALFDLASMIAGNLTGSYSVWREGMPDWVAYQAVPELLAAVDACAPDRLLEYAAAGGVEKRSIPELAVLIAAALAAASGAEHHVWASADAVWQSYDEVPELFAAVADAGQNFGVPEAVFSLCADGERSYPAATIAAIVAADPDGHHFVFDDASGQWLPPGDVPEIRALMLGAEPEETSAAEPPPVPAYPCRAIRIDVRRGADAPCLEVWLFRDNGVAFGTERLLAVEPRTEPQNVKASRSIGPRHLWVQHSEKGASIHDLGSGMSTVVGDRTLAPIETFAMERATVVTLGGVLELSIEPWFGDDHAVHAVCVRRVNNAPLQTYILAKHGIGFWPYSSNPLGPRTDDGRLAPMQLGWLDGGPCVINIALPGPVLSVNDVALGIGAPRALQPGDRIVAGQWVLDVTDEILPETGS